MSNKQTKLKCFRCEKVIIQREENVTCCPICKSANIYPIKNIKGVENV